MIQSIPLDKHTFWGKQYAYSVRSKIKSIRKTPRRSLWIGTNHQDRGKHIRHRRRGTVVDGLRLDNKGDKRMRKKDRNWRRGYGMERRDK